MRKLMMLTAVATAGLMAGFVVCCQSNETPVERLCGDGLDNDADDAIDCDDADCVGSSACGASCNNNGVCDAGETTTSCPADCPSGPQCGNSICEAGEDSASCPGDCTGGPQCGNSICETGEDSASCPVDCTASPQCGNNVCEAGEACDGADLCGETCFTQGLDGGVLSCTQNCSALVRDTCTGAMVCDVSHSSCINPDPCLCLGCNTDGTCGDDDDCVCPDCHNEFFCIDSENCVHDGWCDPYLEGCTCSDCAAHPLCP